MNQITIPFNLTKVSSSLAGADPKWQARVVAAGIVQYDQFCKAVADDSNRSSEDVDYVCKCAMKVLKANVRQGKIVHIGPEVAFRPVIRGSFATKDADYDADKNAAVVVAITSGDTRNCVASGTKFVNQVSKPKPQINSVVDKDHDEECILYIDGTVYIQGKYLAPDSSQPGEGVFLLDAETKEVVATGTITRSDQQLVNVTFGDWPEEGEYLLKLATRGGYGRDYSLSAIEIAVTVVAE